MPMKINVPVQPFGAPLETLEQGDTFATHDGRLCMVSDENADEDTDGYECDALVVMDLSQGVLFRFDKKTIVLKVPTKITRDESE